jgi:hypothetical protein
MKIIITEQQSNDMIPMAIRRRMSDMDDTLYEWLYNTDVGEESENYERLDYIDYVVELLFDEYFLDWAARKDNREEITKYFMVLINIFGDRIGNYWDTYHDRDDLNENVSNFEKQKSLIETLLSRFDFENVCGFDILKDDDLDRVGSVMIAFAGSQPEPDSYYYYLTTRKKVKKIIKDYLGLNNYFLGFYEVKECK